jgi:hypothetical protein
VIFLFSYFGDQIVILALHGRFHDFANLLSCLRGLPSSVSSYVVQPFAQFLPRVFSSCRCEQETEAYTNCQSNQQ